MKKPIWLLVILFIIPVVNAQINLEIEDDVAPGSNNTIKIIIDDAGFWKYFVNSKLKVEIIGPARFLDGGKTKFKDIGTHKDEAEVFNENMIVNKGNSQEKGSIVIYAVLEYNLNKWQFGWVTEDKKTIKPKYQFFEVSGFEIVKDIGDYELLLNKNKQLEEEINSFKKQLTSSEFDKSSMEERIKGLETTVGILEGENKNLKDTNSNLQTKAAINQALPIIIIVLVVFSIGLFIWAIWERKKRKRHHHHPTT